MTQFLQILSGMKKYLSLDKRPSKFIRKIFFTSSGKKKIKKLHRNEGTSNKTYLQKQHFGTFRPIKKF